MIAGGEVREQTCTGNGVTEVGRLSSFSLPSPPQALKRFRYPYTAGKTERLIEKLCAPAVFSPWDLQR